MDNTLIIGLTGAIGAGKTPLAESIGNNITRKVAITIRYFASPLKQLVDELFVPKDWEWQPYDDLKDRMLPCGKTFGQLLQYIGTDVFRFIDPQVWIREFDRRLGKSQIIIRKTDTRPLLVFVPDVRFMNEAEYIQSKGGKIIRLSRRGDSRSRDSKHISEREYKHIKADVDINNSNQTFDETVELVTSHVNKFLLQMMSKNVSEKTDEIINDTTE